jgi:ATP-binding cassette subfamily F protein 3
MSFSSLLGESFKSVFPDIEEDLANYCLGVIESDASLLQSGEALAEMVSDFAGVDKTIALPKCLRLMEILGEAHNPNSSNKPIISAPQLLSAPLKVEGVIDTSLFEDKYMGLEAVKANTNDTIESGTLKDQIKRRNQEQKEREALLKKVEAWENQRRPAPTPARRHLKLGDNALAKVTDVIIDSFSVSVAGRPLIEDSPLKLVVGHRYGLCGRNGIGKTVFLTALARGEIPGIHPDYHVACVEQEIDHLMKDKTRSVLDVVLDVDVERRKLLSEVEKLTAKSTQAAGLSDVYGRLAEIEADAAPAKAATILFGLGVSESMQKQPLASLSGGWRMRVILARALFSEPDLLLLDEPTNHLDVHAVAWLTEYLSESPKTCIIVSHARDFLNDVCTDIIFFDHHKKRLDFIKGDYDTFEILKSKQDQLLEKQIEAQQMERDHIQKFIDRFRYNANRAALVQSRIKALNRLPRLEEITKDPNLVFQFKEPDQLPFPILRLDEISFKYGSQGGFTIRSDGFSMDQDSRIALCGENGSGKSTFIKILVDEASSHGVLNGHVTRNNRLRIGYFSQHHVDTLDVTKSAVAALQSRYYPKVEIGPEAARNHLGSFGITGDLALEPLYCLSGGQKTRVALAIIAYANPHILIMDEPTNHLDMDAVQALIVALSDFKGGVMLVSHDFHTLKCVCDEVWHAENGTIAKFAGDIDEYKKYIRKQRKKQ